MAKKNKVNEVNNALYEKWVEPNMKDVRSLVRYYISNHELYDDIFSEVCCSLLKYIHTYNPDKSFDTWLHIVVKRKVFAEENRHRKLRKNKNDHLLDENLENATFEEASAIPEDPLDMEFYKEHLSDIPYRALCSLKPDWRYPLLMLVNGYTIKEITEHEFNRGAIEWRSVNAIKTRIRIAKDAMKKKMQQHVTSDKITELLSKMN